MRKFECLTAHRAVSYHMNTKGLTLDCERDAVSVRCCCAAFVLEASWYAPVPGKDRESAMKCFHAPDEVRSSGLLLAAADLGFQSLPQTQNSSTPATWPLRLGLYLLIAQTSEFLQHRALQDQKPCQAKLPKSESCHSELGC